jgi:hypothetical protein
MSRSWQKMPHLSAPPTWVGPGIHRGDHLEIEFSFQQTHKNVEGLSTKFVEMETIISALCRTVDTLQGSIRPEDQKSQAGKHIKISVAKYRFFKGSPSWCVNQGPFDFSTLVYFLISL